MNKVKILIFLAVVVLIAAISTQITNSDQSSFGGFLKKDLLKGSRVSEISVQGEFIHEIWEGLDKKGHFDEEIFENRYFVIVNKKERYELDFGGFRPPIETGDLVSVKGKLIDDKIDVSWGVKDRNIEVVKQKNKDGKKRSEKMNTAHADGEVEVRKVAVILYEYQGEPDSLWSIDDYREKIFTDENSANAFFQQNSYGQLKLEGDVRADGDFFGPYQVTYSGQCRTYWWRNSVAAEMAQDDGYDPDNYDNTMFIFPDTNCGFHGIAQVGGSELSLQGPSVSSSVAAHELGHNFGLEHANSVVCFDEEGEEVTTSGFCHREEYGDTFDIMGDAPVFYPLNAFNRGRLGWLSESNVVDVTESGVYALTPLDFAGNQVKTLRIPRNQSDYYYLQYHQPFGFSTVDEGDHLATGISIRSGYDFDTRGYSGLFDQEPSTYWHADATVQPGEVFVDELRGIEIRPLEVGADEATIEINFDQERIETAGIFLWPAGDDHTIDTDILDISCSRFCELAVELGEHLILTAQPEEHWSFVEWWADDHQVMPCGDPFNSICPFRVDRDIPFLFANFRLFNLVIEKYGTGDGDVVSYPPGIDCGEDCTQSLRQDDTYALTAIPDENSRFVRWGSIVSGSSCGGLGANECEVSAPEILRVRFDLVKKLLVRKIGNGGGFVKTISNDPTAVEVNCGRHCEGKYDEGATVSLSAFADEDSVFVEWRGVDCDESQDCDLHWGEDLALELEVVFERLDLLRVDIQGSGRGTIISDPAGINCGEVCEYSFEEGEIVRLIAIPDEGSIFDGWSGACDGPDECAVIIDDVKNVEAGFLRTSPPDIDVFVPRR